MKVGVLAFQGDFAEHQKILDSFGVANSEVRSIADLKDCSHLIFPGGESTVMSRFLWSTGVAEEIQRRVKQGTLSIYGTCAGAILLARHIDGLHPPKSLSLINIEIERNAYGSQLESFDADVTVKGIDAPVGVSFIRAPVIHSVGSAVEVLAEYQGVPVLVRQGKILAGTFHPEARGTADVHRLFVSM